MTSNNPAALQGWVKSTDPKTGRVFYANHITRKTQWEAPEGWVEQAPSPEARAAPPAYQNDREQAEEPLPSNWEVMHDPTTGKPFYVDHERKITTWTRPKPEQPKGRAAVSLQPAPASGGHSAALAKILAQSPASSVNLNRSYEQEASYYQNFAPSHSSRGGGEEVDLSDSLPPLDFKVQKVADALRPNCPHCGAEFTMSKRRHHCRLCGDVFCDACSAHRVTLPLEGPEFDKPVRVCDLCNADVDQGNFFSLRRYLTPLHLYNGKDKTKESDGDYASVATASNVNAALAALTVDLDQTIQNNAGSMDKVTLPPEILVPEIIKHLPEYETSHRAIRAVASLLALESLAGKNDYAVAVYLWGKREKCFDSILKILERSGTDRKTLFVQEQAVRTLYYLTESKTVGAILQKQSERMANRRRGRSGSVGAGSDDGMDDDEAGGVEDLDLRRTLRSLLDHA